MRIAQTQGGLAATKSVLHKDAVVEEASFHLVFNQMIQNEKANTLANDVNGMRFLSKANTVNMDTSKNDSKEAGIRYKNPEGLVERTEIWNRIAKERPELLRSDVTVKGSFDTLEEAKAADIMKKLRRVGLDDTNAAIIAWREAYTKVRRPDGTVPGEGACGVSTLPESIKSVPVGGNPQVREGIGYAYVDRYGYPHVVEDLATALNYSGDGKVYEYNGRFGGGYALDAQRQRSFLNMENARVYTADEQITEELKFSNIPDGTVDLFPLTKEYISKYLRMKRFDYF